MIAPRYYPALDVSWPAHPGADAIELLMGDLYNVPVAAVEDTPRGCRVFFTSQDARERALAAIGQSASVSGAVVTSLDVSDESWAERSQAGLAPIVVDALTIAPPWCERPARVRAEHWIVIEPSMGFGTGHHQSTRLCLRLLQRLALDGAHVLDVGTGSGVLAIAAARLGAAAVVAVDYDPEAMACAATNVRLNAVAGTVTLHTEGVGPGPHTDWDSPSLTPAVVDEIRQELAREPSPAPDPISGAYDVVLGNLTGATLLKLATLLTSSTRRGGHLVVSGFQYFEQDAVAEALRAVGFTVDDFEREDDWVGMQLSLTANPSGSREPSGR
jgi:ribosomal protein L11 methylase PrmA